MLVIRIASVLVSAAPPVPCHPVSTRLVATEPGSQRRYVTPSARFPLRFRRGLLSAISECRARG
jgi:hypothetical protein